MEASQKSWNLKITNGEMRGKLWDWSTRKKVKTKTNKKKLHQH